MRGRSASLKPTDQSTLLPETFQMAYRGQRQHTMQSNVRTPHHESAISANQVQHVLTRKKRLCFRRLTGSLNALYSCDAVSGPLWTLVRGVSPWKFLSSNQAFWFNILLTVPASPRSWWKLECLQNDRINSASGIETSDLSPPRINDQMASSNSVNHSGLPT